MDDQQQQQQQQQQQSPPPPYSLIDEGDRADDKKEETTIHYVTQTDTLEGIALKYGVTMESIRTTNRLNTKHVYERRELIIPNPTRSASSPLPGPDEIFVKKRVEFQTLTKCDDALVAKFYLEDADWEVKTAVSKYNADMEWEAKHPQLKAKRIQRSDSSSASSSQSPFNNIFFKSKR